MLNTNYLKKKYLVLKLLYTNEVKYCKLNNNAPMKNQANQSCLS